MKLADLDRSIASAQELGQKIEEVRIKLAAVQSSIDTISRKQSEPDDRSSQRERKGESKDNSSGLPRPSLGRKEYTVSQM